MINREGLGDRTPRRMPDDVGTLDLQSVHQADDISRHPLDGVAESGLITLPDAAMIKCHDLEPLGEGRYLVLPKGCKPAQSGHKEDWEAHAVPLIIK
jgi:hypothetical protein